MSSFRERVAAALGAFALVASVCAQAQVQSQKQTQKQSQAQPAAYPGVGRPATASEVRAWDIDVRPDFKGLPQGAGSVAKGMEVWEGRRRTGELVPSAKAQAGLWPGTAAPAGY